MYRTKRFIINLNSMSDDQKSNFQKGVEMGKEDAKNDNDDK